jgi:hypothetical protein
MYEDGQFEAGSLPDKALPCRYNVMVPPLTLPPVRPSQRLHSSVSPLVLNESQKLKGLSLFESAAQITESDLQGLTRGCHEQ